MYAPMHVDDTQHLQDLKDCVKLARIRDHFICEQLSVHTIPLCNIQRLRAKYRTVNSNCFCRAYCTFSS